MLKTLNILIISVVAGFSAAAFSEPLHPGNDPILAKVREDLKLQGEAVERALRNSKSESPDPLLQAEYMKFAPDFFEGRAFTYASDILKHETIIESERLKRSGVKLYKRTPKKTPHGTSGSTQYFKVFSVHWLDGELVETVVPVTAKEADSLKALENATVDEQMAVFFERYATELFRLGDWFGSLGGGEYEDLDYAEDQVKDDCFVPEGVYPDDEFEYEREIIGGGPLAFAMGPACFSLAIAKQLRTTDSDAIEEAIKDFQKYIEEISKTKDDDDDKDESLKVVGAEFIDGRPSVIIGIDGLDIRQEVARIAPPALESQFELPPNRYDYSLSHAVHVEGKKRMSKVSTGRSGGEVMVINSFRVSIDTKFFTRNKIRIAGTMESAGESRPFFLETEFHAYRYVPGTYMFKPYVLIRRMGGVLDPEQQAEMREAKEQLADYEKQLAAMPADQRAMAERMVGPQIEKMRSLANSGTVEFTFEVDEYIINPDLSGQQVITPLSSEEELIQYIQRHLQTLGYDPGNTNGELTKQTAVAIMRFQADNDMELTGQATPQLAGILSAAVDAMN